MLFIDAMDISKTLKELFLSKQKIEVCIRKINQIKIVNHYKTSIILIRLVEKFLKVKILTTKSKKIICQVNRNNKIVSSREFNKKWEK